MKLFTNLFTIAIVIALFACKGGDQKAEAATAPEAVEATTMGDTYTVNIAESGIHWIGSKKIGDSSHDGTLALSAGSLSITKGDITGGSFTIDMNSLANIDMAGTEGADKLIGHLKSDDFFKVASFPNATFEITKVTKVMNNADMSHTVSGNLTMLGVSKNISMPATIAMTDGKLTASVKDFALNRTDWGVKYGSGLLGIVGDKVINDDVAISINLVAAM